MAHERRFDRTYERGYLLESLSLFPVMSVQRLYVNDDVARISWSYPTQSSIRQVLQSDPEFCEKLGVVQTFSIPYSEPMTQAVKEFAQGFNPLRNDCDFRGRKLAFTTDVLRKAFSLPLGKFSRYKDHSWWADFVIMSTRLDAVLLFQELVLGKQCPEKITKKHMWYFFAHLSSKVERRSRRPDYAELVHAVLKTEIVKLKEHLDSSKDEGENPRMRKINCGTAITQILLHFGFTREELRHPASLTQNMFETDKITSPLGTRKRFYSVKRICKQLDTAEPSAARLGKEEKHDNKRRRSVGGEPIEVSGDEVEIGSLTGSMLDLQVDEEGNVASTGRDKSAPAASVDLWQTLEESLLIQLHAARIRIQAGTTERDNTMATLLIEKNNIESKFRMVNSKLTQQKNKFDIELAAVIKSKRKVTEKLEKELRSAYEDVAVEKDKSACQICFESQKDTISLPCLHLQYCFTCLDEHRKRSNTCPTCRMPISGVLKADIWK